MARFASPPAEATTPWHPASATGGSTHKRRYENRRRTLAGASAGSARLSPIGEDRLRHDQGLRGDAHVQEGPVRPVDRRHLRGNRGALHQPPVWPLCVSQRHDQAFMRRDRVFATAPLRLMRLTHHKHYALRYSVPPIRTSRSATGLTRELPAPSGRTGCRGCPR